MTVRELISALRKLNPDAPVVVQPAPDTSNWINLVSNVKLGTLKADGSPIGILIPDASVFTAEEDGWEESGGDEIQKIATAIPGI